MSRHPVPGREREFERWLRRLSAAASRASGHLHSDVQPPDEAHPGEWVIVYQFDDAGRLRDWIESPERLGLLSEGAELVDGETRTQIVALADGGDPVTAVASFRVRPGDEAIYDELFDRLVAHLDRLPGFLRIERFDPVEGVQDQTVIAFTFESRDDLDRWFESDERAQFLTDLHRHTEGDRTLNIVGGFGGWFGGPGLAAVKRWKQASVVLLALVPTTLVLTQVRRWLFPDIHWVLAVLYGNVVGVAILSWVLMPSLTRRLAAWLGR